VLIDSKTVIAGHRAVEIRSLLRLAGSNGLLYLSSAKKVLGFSGAKARALFDALSKEGLLKPQDDHWILTSDGMWLRVASAAAALHRTTADRLLKELVGRITKVNTDPYFLGYVEKAVVFGSYLSDASRLGDVDVALHIVRKEPDFEKHVKANAKRAAEEFAKGRQFQNMVVEASWWYYEVVLFLRNRKRGLSLHDLEHERRIWENAPHRVIFPKAPEPGEADDFGPGQPIS